MNPYLILLAVGLVAFVVGLLMIWKGWGWGFGAFITTMGIMLSLLSLLVLVMAPAIFGVPAERLEINISNQMKDPVHVVVTLEGADIIDRNLDPPQWFNGDHTSQTFLHKAEIGTGEYKLAISINNGPAQHIEGLWSLGDVLSIIINADATFTFEGVHGS